jgi:WD40 repeat protein
MRFRTLVPSAVLTLTLALSGAVLGQPESGWKEISGEELSRANAQVGAFSSDGKRLALAGKNTVTLWDTSSGKKTAEISLPDTRKACIGLSFSPDGKLLAVSGSGGGPKGEFVDIVDVEKQSVRASLEGYLTGFFAPDGKTLHLITVPKDRLMISTFCKWDVAAGKVEMTKLMASNGIGTRGRPFMPDPWFLYPNGTFALNRDGTKLFLTTAKHSRLFDLVKGRESFSAVGGLPSDNAPPDGSPWTACIYAPDGGRIALGNQNGRVCLLTPIQGADVVLISADDRRAHPPAGGKKRNAVLCVAFSPDGKSLLSLAEDGKLVRHDGETLKPTASESVAKGPVFAAFSEDRNCLLIIEGQDGTGGPRLLLREKK